MHIENIVKLGGFFIFNRDFKIHLKGGKEMKRVVSMVLALLLAAMLLASCAGGNGDADEGTAEPGESSVPVGENGEIAVVLRSVQGSFWADAIRGIEQAIVELAELGVLASWNAPTESTNLPQQIAIIEDAITRDVMAIALSPGDAVSVQGVLEQCEEKNIPVVTFDVDAESDWPVCLVSSNNYKLGQLAGEALGEAMGGKGLYAILNWNDGIPANGERSWGARDYIQENYPEMELYQMHFTYGVADADLTFARDTLTAVPDIGGFIGGTEGQTTNIISAVQEAGKIEKIAIVGIDITQVSLEYVKDGTLAAVISQNPYNMGYSAAMTAYKAGIGEEVPEFIDSGCAIVTKETMENDEETRKILEELNLLDLA